jgi:RNA polymerase sigma-70 factor (ECF subfamily)
MLTAMKYLQQKEDAEDAVQEVLLRLWTLRSRLSSVSTPEAFAMQTLVNICIDKLRARKETVSPDDCDLGHDLETPYSNLELHDAVELVGRIIDSLPYTQRIIIRMRDIEGYELEEIAAITNTHISAVTVNLSRARKKVKEEFINANKYIRK